MIDPAVLAIAEREVAPRMLQVWKLHHVHGMSFRRIALHLGLNRTWVTDAYDGACRRLLEHGVRVDASGKPYLEETTTA